MCVCVCLCVCVCSNRRQNVINIRNNNYLEQLTANGSEHKIEQKGHLEGGGEGVGVGWERATEDTGKLREIIIREH